MDSFLYPGAVHGFLVAIYFQRIQILQVVQLTAAELNKKPLTFKSRIPTARHDVKGVFDSIPRCFGGGVVQRVPNSFLGPEVSTVFGLCGDELTYLYQPCFNLEHCQLLQCFPCFFLGDLQQKQTREQNGCVSKYGGTLTNHPEIVCFCRQRTLFWSLILRQTPPKKAIISSLIYSLYCFDFGSIFQRYNPKKIQKSYPIMIIKITRFTSRTRGMEPKFQRQGSRKFEIRCI